MTNTTRNTILRLHQCNEWICCNGAEYHLTAERGNATPFTDTEVTELIQVFEEKFNHKIDTEKWIIENWKDQESIDENSITATLHKNHKP